MTAAVPTFGVEEEHFLIDPASRTLQPAATRVVARAEQSLGDLISGEFFRTQLEIKTSPCLQAGQLRAELAHLRMTAAAAAAAEGVRLCASSTPVLADSGPPVVGDHPRYHAGLAQYRAMLADFMVCSLHVHVHLPDRELAVLVSNHLRPWLPLLVAVSANSPFHQGIDTGYADWRAVIRSRFPCLGPPPYAESIREHEELAVAMADSGAMLDALTPFWDVRPNPRLPTVEVRTMDVTADIDDTVALAALVRALVATVAERARAGDAGPHPSSELLRAAYWRAARDGWSGCGVDALTGRLIPASVQLAGLVDHVGAALHRHGDTEVVHALVSRLSARGTGAELQRASMARHGTFAGVVDDLVSLTART